MTFATGGSTTAFDFVVGGVAGVELDCDEDAIALDDGTLDWIAVVDGAEEVVDAGAATLADEARADEAMESLLTAALPPDVHAAIIAISETTAAMGA